MGYEQGISDKPVPGLGQLHNRLSRARPLVTFFNFATSSAHPISRSNGRGWAPGRYLCLNMLGQANSVLWNLLHNTHDELHLQPRGGKGTISGSAYTSETTGLAAGLCIALVLVLIFGLYLMRRRLFRRPANNNDAGPEAQECCEPSHDRLTMSELRSLDITNEPFGAWRHNSVCSQDEDPHGLHNSRECSICAEPYPEENTTLRQLPCGHEFHRRCVDAWLLNRSGTCPLWYVGRSLYK